MERSSKGFKGSRVQGFKGSRVQGFKRLFNMNILNEQLFHQLFPEIIDTSLGLN